MRRLLALAVLSGCLFPDLSSLGGDAGGSDATSDTFVADGSTDVSKDVVAADVTDAGVVSPCTKSHTFCDDFDDGSLGAAWTSVDNNGGTLSQTTTSVTPPFAFQAAVGAGGHPNADLVKTFTTSAQHIHFECDLLVVGAQDAGMEIDYLDVYLSPAPAGFASADFNLERVLGGGVVEQYTRASGADAGSYYDDSIGEDFHTWRHLMVDIDFGKASVTTIVDGTTIDVLAMTPPISSAPATISIGITYAGGLTSPWSIIVDNVVVDLQ